jgi:hypothetical protein
VLNRERRVYGTGGSRRADGAGHVCGGVERGTATDRARARDVYPFFLFLFAGCGDGKTGRTMCPVRTPSPSQPETSGRAAAADGLVGRAWALYVQNLMFHPIPYHNWAGNHVLPLFLSSANGNLRRSQFAPRSDSRSQCTGRLI